MKTNEIINRQFLKSSTNYISRRGTLLSLLFVFALTPVLLNRPQNAAQSRVTITEFSDFQCPYCKRAASVVAQIRQTYGDRVKFVFKQMPLRIHKNAFKAAQASVCAGEQGKFWEYHDRLFAASDLSIDVLNRTSAEVGLNGAAFSQCLESQASRAMVEKDMAEAARLGVSGTPTFFVDGKAVKGAATFDALKQTIDGVLTEQLSQPLSRVELTSTSSQVGTAGGSDRVNTRNAGATKGQQQAATSTTTGGLTLSPVTINFGYQLVGTTSEPMVETITNSGTVPLIITDISLSGRDRRDFIPTYDFTLPVTVAPGNSIAINLTFTSALPWRAGARNARLEIAEKKNSQYVSLTGIGATCGGPLPACSSGCADADGDGLNDVWEIAGGIDFNNDGLIDATHDLLLPAADLSRPNIYLKYDYFVEAGSGTACVTNANCTIAGEVCDTGSAKCVKHTHAPSAVAMNTVRTAFSNHGVILTYFNDPIVGGTADALTEHVDPLLNHTDSIVSYATGAELAALPECAGPGGVSFYDLKHAHFPSRLAPVYHYAVFSHYVMCDESQHVGVACVDDSECQAINIGLTCDNFRCSNASHCAACPLLKAQPPQSGASGVAENDNFEGGNDLIVSLGGWVDQGLPVTDTLMAGAFMHELGHNLGLTHGGGRAADNHERYKPNFISIMGYSYNLTGIGMTSAPGPFSTTNIDPSVTRRIDYSENVLPTLFEYNLDENAGIGGPPASTDVAVFYANFGTCKVYAPTNGSPVDWDIAPPVNSMGQCLPYTAPLPYTDSGITADISASGSLTQLLGHRDWDDLLYKFQCSTDGLADGVSVGSVAAASRLQDNEPAPQDGELTFQEAFARHIIYPQRKVPITILDDSSRASKSVTSPSLCPTITVTLLGSRGFKVKEIEQSSLLFGGTAPMLIEMQDVNGDGKVDLILTFDRASLKLNPNAKSAFLNGWLKNSQEIVAEGMIDTAQ